MNLEDAEALARKITERRAKMKQQQQTGSFGTSEPPRQKPKRAASPPPQKVRLDSDPGVKAVIIILSIVVAAILIWVLALGPYMRMG